MEYIEGPPLKGPLAVDKAVESAGSKCTSRPFTRPTVNGKSRLPVDMKLAGVATAAKSTTSRKTGTDGRLRRRRTVIRPSQATLPDTSPPGVESMRMRYVPSRDGQRFIVNTQTGDPPLNPITVVLNWTAGLKK